ncbi:hypothetical protein HDU93_008720 [Gonapodya sp. JEL0774]|nr:hypothetical protein HDU93_008720 [Gonapodya sp. JEL0774]
MILTTPHSVEFQDKKRRRILIVGGGYAGLLMAKALYTTLRGVPVDIEVLEARDKFYHNVGSCRGVSEAGFAKVLWIPYDRFPVPVRTNCRVLEVHHDHIVTDSGEILLYEYLVVATGSVSSPPAKFLPTVKSHEAIGLLERIQRAVAQSQHIVIIGGGAAGCELAGDIADQYPNTRVTLVEALGTILPGRAVTEYMRKTVAEKLSNKGVVIVTGARVLLEEGELRTSSTEFPDPTHHVLFTDTGISLDSDLQLICSGNLHYNGTCLSSLAVSHPTILDQLTHEVCVRRTLQLQDEELPHIFGLGDVSNTHASKTVVSAEMQAQVVEQNIMSLLSAEYEAGVDRDDFVMRMQVLRRVDNLREFSAQGPLLFLALGKYDGAAQLPFVGVLGGWFMRQLKSADVMTHSWWKKLGYDTVPS